ncbi:MAG: hypothetical protein JRF63_07570 [Deltaproteobacteria bacterium]|nr:hypothetical protein [Deltaproteobacteria bacterium]
MGDGAERIADTVEEWQITAVGGIDPLVLIAVGACAIVAVVWTWRSLDPRITLRRRIAIGVLRAVVLVLALALLLQPTLRFRQFKAAPAHLAILVDGSASMARGDGESRLAAARELIADQSSELEDLASRHRIVWYRFADDLELVETEERATQEILEAKGTDIRGALTSLINADATEPLVGVVLLSDGGDTGIEAGSDPEEQLSWAESLEVPINTVALTRAGRRKDLSITAARVDPFAFSRSETPIAISVRSIGYESQQVEVTLSQDGSVMQRRKVDLVGGEGKLTFTTLPSRLGRHVLTLSMPVPDGDEVPENNTAHVAFDVIRDKFRVLHVAGHPSWGQRFLREFLSSWPRVDLVSFYIMRTPYQSSVRGAAGLALIPFPTAGLFEQHLDEFDIVVFQDFDPAEVGVEQYLDEIAKFVEDGGALVVLGGAKGFGSGALGKSAVADLLPVKLLPGGTQIARLESAKPFRPRMTEAGERHPLMRLEEDPQENVALWKSLSRLDGIARVARTHEQGVKLAEHPSVRADDGPAPLIAVREVDRGRTMTIATDSLWRWRFSSPMGGGPADVYPDLWRRAIAWLTRDPDLDRLRVDVKPWTVGREQPVEIGISMVDEAYRPAPGEVLECTIAWLDRDGVERFDTFSARLDDEGTFKREWRPKEPGPHRITVRGSAEISRTDRFLVEEAQAELSRLDPDEPLLEALARTTSGHHSRDTLEPDKLELIDAPAREVLSRKDIPLWDHWITLIAAVALLAAEWFLRRRSGLT